MNSPGEAYLGYQVLAVPLAEPCTKCGGEIVEVRSLRSTFCCAKCGHVLCSMPAPSREIRFHRSAKLWR